MTNGISVLAAAAFALCLPALVGCAGAAGRRSAVDGPVSPSPDRLIRSVPALAGVSVEGREISTVEFGTVGDTALVIGGMHGNEPAGATLARELCGYLADSPAAASGRAVVVLSAANPDGLARNRRWNARGVDLNRNFATGNRRAGIRGGAAALSEPETRFIVKLIERHRPGIIVQIHQPLACIDWDGPAFEPARLMSRACGLPLKKLGARPGSLGSYAGEGLGIATITLELPKSATALSGGSLWRKYGPALIAAIEYRPASKEQP